MRQWRAGAIARTSYDALKQTTRPSLTRAGKGKTIYPSDYAKLEEILRAPIKADGGIYKFSMPRSETISAYNTTISASMGTAGSPISLPRRLPWRRKSHQGAGRYQSGRDPQAHRQPIHLLAELGMARRGNPLTLEAGVGPLVLNFEEDRARFTTAQPVDIRASTLNQRTAARLLGLDEHQVISQPVLASCGLPFHLIELDSLEALGRALPSPSVWADWITPSGHEQIYLHVADTEESLRSRMFSTEGGVREDPATGSAAAALAGKLAEDKCGPGHWYWHIQQGIEMGRPSHIFAEAEHDGTAVTIHISGQAIIIGGGTLRLDRKRR